MYDPPPGYDDMLGDAEHCEMLPNYYPLEVPEVGTVIARKPLPNAVPALAMAANSKIDAVARTDYLTLFVKNHLGEGELERIWVAMICEEMPPNAVERVAREIAVWGTARPTLPSSH